MPKSVEIEDFAAKLGLVIKQLDWSRGKLAQQVGIDKSLAGRWLRGASRPTPHSLTRLTATVAQTVTGLKSDDWRLPIDQFARRIGADPAAAALLAANSSGPSRFTVAGLRYPPVAAWGEPYLGLWAGFYQSVTNRGRVLLCALHFFIDEFGLRCSCTAGTFTGEGPVLPTRTHLQCLFDVGPLYDRVAFFMFNGVRQPKAAVIDGIGCIIAPDSGGSPTASPMLLFRVDEGPLSETATDMDALAASISQIHERADSEIARTGDAFAVLRDLAPLEVLRAVTPVVGDGTDHVLRRPAARSLAVGTFALSKESRDVATNLRRALGLERTRPRLRLIGAGKE
jgi:transcriptional regulator with XRE-family HTH domain